MWPDSRSAILLGEPGARSYKLGAGSFQLQVSRKERKVYEENDFDLDKNFDFLIEEENMGDIDEQNNVNGKVIKQLNNI